MHYTYKIGGAVFVFALMASVIIPAFAENGNVTGTSTKSRIENEGRIGTAASSTAARLEREAKKQEKSVAAQCLRGAVKSAEKTYKSAVQKAQDDYKAAVMAARQAMLDAKKTARTNYDSAKNTAKIQCAVNTQTGTSTSPTL